MNGDVTTAVPLAGNAGTPVPENQFWKQWKEASLSKRVALAAAVLIVAPPLLLRDFAYCAIPKIAKFTYTHLLAPLGQSIKAIVKFIFNQLVNLGKATYNHVIAPIGRLARKLVVLTCDYILSPIGRAIKTVLSETLRLVYNYLLVPVVRLIKNVLILTYDYVLKPLGRATAWIYQNVIKSVGRAIKWTYQNILTPVARAVKMIVVGSLKFIFNRVLAPICRTIKNVLILTYDYVLKPLGRTIAWIYQNVIKSLDRAIKWAYQNILTSIALAIKMIVVESLKFVCNRVLVPSCRTIKNVAVWAYDNVLTPLGQLIKKAALWASDTVFKPIIYFVCDNILLPIASRAAVCTQVATDALFVMTQFVYQNIVQPVSDYAAARRKWTQENIIDPSMAFAREMINVVIPAGFQAITAFFYKEQPA